jgi:hypothetical protein
MLQMLHPSLMEKELRAGEYVGTQLPFDEIHTMLPGSPLQKSPENLSSITLA